MILKEAYIKLPPGVNCNWECEVCRLKHSLYGLKEALTAWFEKFQQALHKSFPSMFLRQSSSGIAVFLVYVNDIIIIGPDMEGI